MSGISQKVIKSARITEMPKGIFDPMPEVWVFVEGSEKEVKLFDYYPDELSFSPSEFIGLTVQQAISLKFKKDQQYLRT
jgi:hypothetical protein